MRVLLCFLVALVAMGVVAQKATNTNTAPFFWPIPKQYYQEGPAVSAIISSKLRIIPTCKTSVDLQDGFKRFREQIFGMHTADEQLEMDATLQTIHVCMFNDLKGPYVAPVDESYSITAFQGTIAMECKNVYGCYYAFTTLNQMISYDYIKNVYLLSRAIFQIIDEPQFVHRGLLIDTARHWQPLNNILRVIDALAMTKMNVLHWHIVDWQSWPYMSKKYPQLVEKSAYSQTEVFNEEDIKQAVEYARKRGVRIMIELDTPSHVYMMSKAMPEIFPDGGCPDNVHNYDWALDFTKNITYEVMENLWDELIDLFPSHLLHIGGDEVNTSCWKQKDYIHKWCKQHNMTVADGTLFYLTRITQHLTMRSRSYAGWQELWENFGTKLPKDTVIQQWLPYSVTLPKNVTSHGYRLIWSDASIWYLDKTNTAWQSIYDAEPCKGLTHDECSLVLGGEGCLWGESVDASDFFSTGFPRVTAIAERLWTPIHTVRNNVTEERFAAMRCHMINMGIPVAPSKNGIARQGPPTYDSCFKQ